MSDNPYKTPASCMEPLTEKDAPALWNPDAAGALSLLFSPIFGSYIIAKNWEALGETEKWMWASIGILLLSAIHSIIAFIYIIIWYVAVNRPQAKYLKENIPDSRPSRSWKKPVLVALTINSALIALIVFAVTHPPSIPQQIPASVITEHSDSTSHTAGNSSFTPDGKVCSTIANHTYCSYPDSNLRNSDTAQEKP